MSDEGAHLLDTIADLTLNSDAAFEELGAAMYRRSVCARIVRWAAVARQWDLTKSCLRSSARAQRGAFLGFAGTPFCGLDLVRFSI